MPEACPLSANRRHRNLGRVSTAPTAMARAYRWRRWSQRNQWKCAASDTSKLIHPRDATPVSANGVNAARSPDLGRVIRNDTTIYFLPLRCFLQVGTQFPIQPVWFRLFAPHLFWRHHCVHVPLEFLARAGIDPAARLIATAKIIDFSMVNSRFHETFL